eukprot:SAG11_NODE_1489_length_4814_cov_2.132131_3_plen_130_part_00
MLGTKRFFQRRSPLNTQPAETSGADYELMPTVRRKNAAAATAGSSGSSGGGASPLSGEDAIDRATGLELRTQSGRLDVTASYDFDSEGSEAGAATPLTPQTREDINTISAYRPRSEKEAELQSCVCSAV